MFGSSAIHFNMQDHKLINLIIDLIRQVDYGKASLLYIYD